MKHAAPNGWLVASNPTIYNILGALESCKTITWGLTVKVSVGDMIYVYMSAPASRITYRFIVDKVDVPESEMIGSEYWIKPFNNTRNLTNLRLIAELYDDKLQLHYVNLP